MTATASSCVFVYGTLRRGERNDINRLQPAPVFLGVGHIPGRLYDLGWYPGVILGGAETVVGEVYAITPQLEHRLDLLEEVAPQPTGEYARRQVEVALPDRRLVCLVYEIHPDRTRGRPLIASGDWMLRG